MICPARVRTPSRRRVRRPRLGVGGELGRRHVQLAHRAGPVAADGTAEGDRGERKGACLPKGGLELTRRVKVT